MTAVPLRKGQRLLPHPLNLGLALWLALANTLRCVTVCQFWTWSQRGLTFFTGAPITLPSPWKRHKWASTLTSGRRWETCGAQLPQQSPGPAQLWGKPTAASRMSEWSSSSSKAETPKGRCVSPRFYDCYTWLLWLYLINSPCSPVPKVFKRAGGVGGNIMHFLFVIFFSNICHFSI